MSRTLIALIVLATACTSTTDESPKTETGQVDTGDGVVDSDPDGPQDADGDGFYDDCDDNNPDIFPGATEFCDGLDNDCDNVIDEDAIDATAWYADEDGDGFGDPDTEITACDAPAGHVSNDSDCDDDDARFNPTNIESDCEDPNDYNCDGSVGYADDDNDGFAACAECDDSDADVNPDADETCTGVDDNCNGLTDDEDPLLEGGSTWYADADGDGVGTSRVTTEACEAPDAYVASSNDCDDLDSSTYPGAPELCDETDNDCDGSVDEGVGFTWYADADGDGYGDAASSTTACDAPPGYSANGDDCDDNTAATSPAAYEICDGLDNNCDGSIDEAGALNTSTWYADSDGDGYGDAGTSTDACSAPSGFVADGTDCDDTLAGANPGATETCNGVDDNCDGTTDEASAVDATTWYVDLDGDGYGSSATSQTACSAPLSYVADATDCDDLDRNTNPDGTEVCDTSNADEDCDGLADDTDSEGASGKTLAYPDADGDGYGDGADAGTPYCDPPSNMQSNNTDCDDTSSSIHPGASEVCDASDTDEDCDGQADDSDVEGAGGTSLAYTDSDGDGFGDESSTGAPYCDPPSGLVDNNTDCNDSNSAINANCYLYTFSTHDFTTCGVTGRTGPSLSDCQSTYSTTGDWDNDTAYLDMTTQGIQRWTVPATASYRISATGAAGKDTSASYTGGTGATIQGDFDLTQGEVVLILVGQLGGANATHGNENGGGGGSFVVRDAGPTPLVVAGGGGGAPSTSYSGGCTRTNGEAQVGTSGKTVSCTGYTGTGGSGGDGGSSNGCHQGAAGGGFFTNGGDGTSHCTTPEGGIAFVNGGEGGRQPGCYDPDPNGGFGGGGAGGLGGPGGGGGYSGGGAAGCWSGSADYGGGGGSYNIGTNQVNTAGTGSGDGSVTITFQSLN
jgi:hypothetical protein